MAAQKKPVRTRKPAPRRTIVLTGANTFLGMRILHRLQARGDASLVVIDIKRPADLLKENKFYKVDLTQPTADALLADILNREQADTVIHLAFLSNPSRNQTYAHELEVIGTLNLLHACAEVKLRKLVVRSTTMVYGAHPANPNFLTEDMEPKPPRHYKFVRDKAEAEELVRRYARKHPETQVSILRLASMLGPTVRNFSTDYLRRPACLTLLGYDPLYQVVHENDVIDAFELALESNKPGIFNIVAPGVLPLSTLITLAGRIAIHIAHPLAYPLTQTAWIAGLSPVPGPHLDFIRYLCIADGEKAKKVLGFTPRHSTRETVEAFAGVQRLRDVRLLKQAD